MRTKTVCLSKRPTTTKKDELYNDFLIMKKDLKFPQDQNENASNLFKYLTDTLSKINSNQSRFHKGFASSHSLALPIFFKNIYQKEYFDWRSHKRAKPILSQETLVKCSYDLFDILGAWNHTTFSDEELIKTTRNLEECLKSYAGYLLKAKERMAINREMVQSYHDRVSISNLIE